MRTTKDFQVGFRVKKHDRDEIFKQADEDDYSISEFLRKIILKHLRRGKTRVSLQSDKDSFS